jgi:hypothetical protein
MKKLTFIGEQHSCPECVKEEIEYTKDSDSMAVEIIGFTQRNNNACQSYNTGCFDVNKFISLMNEYSWSRWRDFLIAHKPLFVEAREREQKILPLRPWGPNDHYLCAEKYICHYLSEVDDLSVILGETCAEGFLKYPEQESPDFKKLKSNAEVKYHSIHKDNKHKEQ